MKYPGNPCAHVERTASCDLLAQLQLSPIGDMAWQGSCRSGRAVQGRAFGGHLAAHSLLAAALTVADDKSPHSMHMYFLSGGDIAEPFTYKVEQVRDGRSFSVRHVAVMQGGKACATVTASFHVAEESPEHQWTVSPMPTPPSLDDETNRSADQMMSGLTYITSTTCDNPRIGAPSRSTWIRLDHALDAGSPWHAIIVAFISDMGMSRTIDLPYQDNPGRRMAASLDHTVWFHRATRVDDWLLYEQASPLYASGRGLCLGQFRDASGCLIASAGQEAAIRRNPE
jgi:acyl-CoA thioesterase-2